MQSFTWLKPLPIEIACCQRASVIAVDYSIHVKHWYYVELEMVLQVFYKFFFFLFGVEQCVNKSMYHPRGSCFSGMNSAREHYNLLFLVGVFVCYVEVLDLVSCQGFAEEVAFYSLLLRQILI